MTKSPTVTRTKESAGRYWVGEYNIVHERHRMWRVWWRDTPTEGFHTLGAATDYAVGEINWKGPT